MSYLIHARLERHRRRYGPLWSREARRGHHRFQAPSRREPDRVGRGRDPRGGQEARKGIEGGMGVLTAPAPSALSKEQAGIQFLDEAADGGERTFKEACKSGV